MSPPRGALIQLSAIGQQDVLLNQFLRRSVKQSENFKSLSLSIPAIIIIIIFIVLLVAIMFLIYRNFK